jgi:hypothetical protein
LSHSRKAAFPLEVSHGPGKHGDLSIDGYAITTYCFEAYDFAFFDGDRGADHLRQEFVHLLYAFGENTLLEGCAVERREWGACWSFGAC